MAIKNLRFTVQKHFDFTRIRHFLQKNPVALVNLQNLLFDSADASEHRDPEELEAAICLRDDQEDIGKEENVQDHDE
ncbi:hypothetical protein BGZ83_002263 [Gryganskiella cystojenkinii]|nr:hypothetical protein BGZ83_002263 [Gryganskiella cystojenkinii]